MGKRCDRCRQALSSCDDHLTCAKCRFTARICTLDANNPCSKSLRDAKQKAFKRGTRHWTCNVPALLTWMESASTSSYLMSEVSSLADSDIRDVDFDRVNVGAHSHLVEVSVHQGPVEATSAIVEVGWPRPWIIWSLRRIAPHC